MLVQCVVLFWELYLFFILGIAAENASTTESSTTSVSDHNDEYRPLTVGDTFTPSEMLPVAKKLIQISGPVGEGKGIVSSAPSPQHLAERLYEAFSADIAGLNALQALALSGQSIDADIGFKLSIINKPKSIDDEENPVNCKYKLLKKKVDRKRDNSVNRRALKIAQKLGKKRKLKIHPAQKPVGKHRRALKIAQKLGKKRQLKVQPPHSQLGQKHRRDSSKHNTDEGTSSTQISHPVSLYETASSKPESSTQNDNKYFVTGSTSSGNFDHSLSTVQDGYSNTLVNLNTSATLTPEISSKMKSFSFLSSILPKSLNDILIKKQTTIQGSSNQQLDLDPSASVNPRLKAEFSPAPVTDINENLKFKSPCHYAYGCTHPVDMDSCQLYVSCNKKDIEDGFHIKHLEDEHEKGIKEVRKIFGIKLVDEEVEKIIERRYLLFKSRKKNEDGDAIERVKHLEQFFARVESENKGGFTVPMKPTEANYVKKDV